MQARVSLTSLVSGPTRSAFLLPFQLLSPCQLGILTRPPWENLQFKEDIIYFSQLRSGLNTESPAGFLCHTDYWIIFILKCFKDSTFKISFSILLKDGGLHNILKCIGVIGRCDRTEGDPILSLDLINEIYTLATLAQAELMPAKGKILTLRMWVSMRTTTTTTTT